MTGMAVDDWTRPPLIVNFEPNPAVQSGQVRVNITRAVNDGVGDHFIERQLGVRSAQTPG